MMPTIDAALPPNAWLPLLVLASSLLPGLVIFFLAERRYWTRTLLNLAGSLVKLMLVGAMLWGVFHQQQYAASLPLLPGLDLVLRVRPLSLLFLALSAGLWLLTTLYAIGYLEDSPNRSRFFGFFSLCVTATVGVAMAGNLLTFLLFFELLTLTTYPLVVHRGTEEARRAGQIYLAHTVIAGSLLLAGTVWLYTLTGTLTFTSRGFVADLVDSHRWSLIAIFVLLIIGVGVKAALVPLQSWLPRAMVAPAPVSALLHAVAVVKAGAFGVVLIVYDVFGVEVAAELGVTKPLALVAAFTILYGSLRALFQDNLKRRLAFSTISQVSYIVLGVAIVGPLATVGGLVHLVHQGVMKITLFFCAGNLAETLGIHKVSEMNGVGRRMPWTMLAFSIGVFGMIGLPPVAGFISKWYLGLGALEAGLHWPLFVLAGSSLLNAAYFLPILHRAWFCEPPEAWPEERDFGGKKETAWLLLLPPLVTAALSLLIGLFASMPFTPLEWARLIAEREFYQP
ncbi:proton-conducting transporter membrane subunit [Lamprobacter modestohalophilus]|uniref:complex I subunit 5 family protein n=1 Tax=Lamprobacter modestohalophilus TaxID=1064514 RepID=UPI002ADEE9D2|nr:proton-conducting transporter membrane subunit [Lamprobacter modestohalophilus]MEA1052448.1 proton-conducting transporter membrane subunit [Lamprobacter modestohalophilus]